MPALAADGAELAENPLSVNNIEVQAGQEACLVLTFKPTTVYQGFEFRLGLPEGVSFIEGPTSGTIAAELNPDVAGGHVFAGLVKGAPGQCAGVVYSPNNDAVGQGEWVLKIPVAVDESFGGLHEGYLSDCRFGGDDGLREDEFCADTPFSVKLIDVGVDAVFAPGCLYDVFDVSGLSILRGASPDKVKALATGIYILKTKNTAIKVFVDGKGGARTVEQQICK